jgi:hypothetical protein
MANKKLFGLVSETTPSDSSMRIAYGKSTEPAKNMTLTNLKNWIAGSNPIKSVTLQIGLWNMNYIEEGEGGKSFQLESSPGVLIPYANIRGISSVIISTDNQEGYYDYYSGGFYGGIAPVLTIQKTSGGASALLYMKPTEGSLFQTSPAFNDGAVNRGWVTILYID